MIPSRFAVFWVGLMIAGFACSDDSGTKSTEEPPDNLDGGTDASNEGGDVSPDEGIPVDADESDGPLPDTQTFDTPIDTPSDQGQPDAAQDTTTLDTPVDSNPGVDECPMPASRCTGYASREVCENVGGRLRLRSETCSAGSGCYDGECVVGQCSDECTLNQSGCALFSVTTGAEVAPDADQYMADRARLYRAHVERDVLPQGGVVETYYSDQNLNQVIGFGGEYDSAEFTGVYLMSESFRAMVTGSVDADRLISKTSQDMDLRFRITGSPGYMARFVQNTNGTQIPSPNITCPEDPSDHCNVSLDGQTYNWMGNTSRDMYAGAVTGLTLAYKASHDEATRSMLRDHVVTMVEELMIERTLPVRVVVNDFPVDTEITSRYILLNPTELEDGRIVISVDTDDLEDSSSLAGVREFVPDMADIFYQIEILSWLPRIPIPRAGSSIMLSAFFLAALEVTEGVPEYAVRRQAIETFYNAESDYWRSVAMGWEYNRECGAKYYAANIAFIPAYLFAHLEDHPSRSSAVRDQLVAERMYGWVDHHKNPWFGFIAAAHSSTRLNDAITMSQTQLSLFPSPPRRHRILPDTGAHAINHGCDGEEGSPMAYENDALDMNERPAEAFSWQRHPWRLNHQIDVPTLVYPGVGYLAAYWMGRYHGFLQDERPGVCARMR